MTKQEKIDIAIERSMANLKEKQSEQSAMSTLNDLDSTISERITEIEGILRERYSILLSFKIDDKRSLCFGKTGGVWGLYIEQSNGCHSLSAAARDVRAESFPWIASLVMSADAQVAANVEQRRAALSQFDSLLSVLR